MSMLSNLALLIYLFKYETIETHARAFLTLIILAIVAYCEVRQKRKKFNSVQNLTILATLLQNWQKFISSVSEKERDREQDFQTNI